MPEDMLYQLIFFLSVVSLVNWAAVAITALVRFGAKAFYRQTRPIPKIREATEKATE